MNEQLKSDLLKNEADEFWANCESKAAELEITVDYYLEEFYIYFCGACFREKECFSFVQIGMICLIMKKYLVWKNTKLKGQKTRDCSDFSGIILHLLFNKFPLKEVLDFSVCF